MYCKCPMTYFFFLVLFNLKQFMDLRTRYTALVTLMTQYVKFASETLKRTEDEEVRSSNFNTDGFLHLQLVKHPIFRLGLLVVYLYVLIFAWFLNPLLCMNTFKCLRSCKIVK